MLLPLVASLFFSFNSTAADNFKHCADTLSKIPESGYKTLWDENSISKGNPKLVQPSSKTDEFSNYEMENTKKGIVKFSKVDKDNSSVISINRIDQKAAVIQSEVKNGDKSRTLKIAIQYDPSGSCFVDSIFGYVNNELVAIDYNYCKHVQIIDSKLSPKEKALVLRNSHYYAVGLPLDDESLIQNANRTNKVCNNYFNSAMKDKILSGTKAFAEKKLEGMGMMGMNPMMKGIPELPRPPGTVPGMHDPAMLPSPPPYGRPFYRPNPHNPPAEGKATP